MAKTNLERIRVFHPVIYDDLQEHGFITEEQVNEIANHNETRLCLLLIRCNGGRFLAPAQNVKHYVQIINECGKDHVRDISIPAGV